MLLQDTVTCHGDSNGSISLEAIGGTSAYTYLWESGSTIPQLVDVASGFYNLTITDSNDCVLDTAVFIPQNDSISFNANVQDISCFGADDGRIILENFQGGKAPYIAFLEDLDSLRGSQFNQLIPDNYTVIVEDRLGCTKQFSTLINEPPKIWVEIIEPQDSISIMLGESIDLSTNYNVSNPEFEWLPSNWLSCDDCEAPLTIPFDSIKYVVNLSLIHI